MQYRKLDTNAINVSDAYQRGISKQQVSRIVKNYDEHAFGVLVVGIRSDGSLWCVDGQTRLLVAKRIGLKQVPCITWDSMGKADEAAMFRRLNDQRNMSKLDKLFAAVCEGDPDSLAMMDIVERNGYKIGFRGAKGWPHIQSIVPLINAYELGVLDRCLKIITEAWGAIEDVAALQVPMMGGLAIFIKQFSDVIDDEELVKRLQKYPVRVLVGQCEPRRMQGGGRERAMCRVIVDLWNKGKRVNKLEYEN